MGVLHLTGERRAQVKGRASLLVRPYSLADPRTIETLRASLRDTVGATKGGLVYAYALDDEIALGSFNNPADVDVHPASVAWYRRWLRHRYGRIENVNAAWRTAFPSFAAVEPRGFDAVRATLEGRPPRAWNLSPWMEWRRFMDYQFARVLADLTRYTNTLDGATPAGFVGAQQPSGYGGFDYALLTRAVQWMEAYDVGGTAEILRSWWNTPPRRPRAQTYGVTAEHKRNVWVLWSRLAHGNQVTIAWPEGWVRDDPAGARALAPAVRRLGPTLADVQGAAGELLVHPDTYLDADPIGVYYSHPSIRAGWAMDAATAKGEWPRRLSSVDDDNRSSGWVRVSWCKLLEDLGYQYDFVSYLDVEESRVDLARTFKVIILPHVHCLSDAEAAALRAFVRAGGTLVADGACGILTETGRGRSAGALDDLFAIARDESRGFWNGRGVTEIDGTRYREPLPRRLHAYDGALRFGSMVVFERGIRAVAPAAREAAGSADVVVRTRRERGQAVYLNLTPLAYADFAERAGPVGQGWRATMRVLLDEAGLRPRVSIAGADGAEPWMESLLWRNGARACLAVLKNPARVADPAEFARVIDQPARTITLSLALDAPVRGARNLRTGVAFEGAGPFRDAFNPWEANVYELRF
jgi:hypothetical protein